MQTQNIKINDKIILVPWGDYGGYLARYTDDDYGVHRICIFYLHFPIKICFFGYLNHFEQSFLFQHNKIYNRAQLEELKTDIDQFLIKISQLQSFI